MPTPTRTLADGVRSGGFELQGSLPLQPKLAPWLVHVDLGDGRSQLRAQHFCFPLPQAFLTDMLADLEPHLRGELTCAEICEAVAERHPAPLVTFFLKALNAGGALQEGSRAPKQAFSPQVQSQVDFISHYTPRANELVARLAEARVAIVGESDLTQGISEELEALGLTPQRVKLDALTSLNSDLLIAASPNGDFRFFDTVNRSCLARGLRWIHVALEGPFALLGPTIVPRQNACYHCFQRRLDTNLGHEGREAYRARLAERGPPFEGQLHPFTTALRAQLTLEVLRLLTGFAPPATLGRYYEFDAQNPMPRGHDVLRVPRCPACGRGPFRDPWDRVRGGLLPPEGQGG